MPFSPDSLKIRSSLPESTRRWPQAVVEGLAMLGGFLYWGIFGLLMTLTGGLLHLILPRPLGIRVGRACIHFLFRQFVRYLELTGLLQVNLNDLERLGKLDHPFIIAPNHASLWDAVFILARLPHAVCVMKKSILKNPWLGGGARLAGHIPNDAMTRMIRAASDALIQGGQLVLFPEGTRTEPESEWINPLKGGCALVASRSAVPVYPLFIRSNSRFLQKGWPLWKKPAFPLVIEFQLGNPIRKEAGESLQGFTQRLQSIFEDELCTPHPLRRRTNRI